MLCAWRHTLYTSVPVGGGGATLHAFACYEYHEAFVMRALFAIDQKGKWGRRNGDQCVHDESSSILKIAKRRDKVVPGFADREGTTRVFVCRSAECRDKLQIDH